MVPDAYDVVVVGGGVSGTTCAAGCAQRGLRVLLLNSSLDVIGLPGYGPVLGHPCGSVRARFDSLPLAVRRAWLPELLADEEGSLAVADPRRVSLRLKWELEALEGLDPRQGLAVAVEAQGFGGRRTARVTVRTALEEEFHSLACVLTPGLALGGRCMVGDQEFAGGRYGEVAAAGLWEHLRAKGVAMSGCALQVGSCLRRQEAEGGGTRGQWEPAWWDGLLREWGRGAEARLLQGVDTGGSARETAKGTRGPAPDLSIAPPAHRAQWAAVLPDGRGLFPAGEALDEWYLSPGIDPGPLVAAGLMETRPPYTVTAHLTVTQDGRIPGVEGVWAAGRATGGRTYWDSLLSGEEMAQRVMAQLSRVPAG